ncbi:GTP-binding protein [Caballeronia sordidicola]|uniref:GTP-binding protein n=1 Tax=Caballeronia sordidicola TaxID=196367 RepID=UPI00117DC82C
MPNLFSIKSHAPSSRDGSFRVPANNGRPTPKNPSVIQNRSSVRSRDRQQTLVVIGTGLNEIALRSGFDHCLPSDAELERGARRWSTNDDPFCIGRCRSTLIPSRLKLASLA